MPTDIHVLANEADRALAATTAQLLAAAWPLPCCALLLLALSAGSWALTGAAAHWPASLMWLCFAAGGVLHWRVLLDARLLAAFADGRLQPPQLDAALDALGLHRGQAPRPMAARCRGAMRLLAYAAVSVVGQLLLLWWQLS